MASANTALMKYARTSLENKWLLAIVSFVIYTLIVGSLSSVPFFGVFGTLLLGGPFLFGITKFSLAISREEEAKIEQIFDGFKDLTRTLVTYLWMVLYVFLWSLLLIVPGIIKGIAYSMTFFILNDDATIAPKEALAASEKMMDGFKMKYFGLQLRFFGWALLCILTLGIGFLWLIPYIHVTNAKFYEDIKSNPQQLATEN